MENGKISDTPKPEEIMPVDKRSKEWKDAHPNEPKRVLLTGAGGAIGVHVLAYILEHTNWEVVAVDSFKAEHKGFYDRLLALSDLMPADLEAKIGGRLSIVVHDLRAPFTPREVEKIGDIDYIVNLASRSDVSASLEANPSDPTGASADFVRNNTDLMLHMLDYARVAMPSVFLQFSTDEVYGPAPKDSGGHKEWEAILPSNPYSASKAVQEALAIAWWRSYNVPLIITNTMNNFGETQAPSKFPALIQSKIEAGETIEIHGTHEGELGSRYYIHSRNTADAIVFILKNIRPQLHGPGELDRPLRYNIVGDKQLDNKQLVEVISELMQKPAQCKVVNFHAFNPGHDLHYGLNGDALKEAGWHSPETFEEGMHRTIEWQRKHPDWMKK